MSRHNCIPDCSSSGIKLRLFYTMICSFLYDSSDPPDLAHSSRPSVIFKEEWFLPRFNCIPEYDHISLCVDDQDIWCIPIVYHTDLNRSHVSSKFMVTALDNQLHNVTCLHMPRMLFVYLEMTAVRYGPSKPYVMLDVNVLVIYLKQLQMIATTEPGMINPTLALDSCYRTDWRRHQSSTGGLDHHQHEQSPIMPLSSPSSKPRSMTQGPEKTEQNITAMIEEAVEIAQNYLETCLW